MEYLNLNRASRLLADLTGNPSATDDVQAIIEAGAQGEIPIYWRNAAQVWTRLSDFKGDLKGTDSAARHLQLEPHTVAKLETDTNATVLSFALTGQDVDTLTKLFGDIIDVDGNLLGYRHTIGDEVVTITRDQLRVRTDDLKAYAATLSPDEVVVAPAHAPATVNQVQAIEHTLPDPERRLARLRAIGGSAKYKNSQWKFSKFNELVAIEKGEGRKRFDTHTIRDDLKEAAQAERDVKKSGPFDALLKD